MKKNLLQKGLNKMISAHRLFYVIFTLFYLFFSKEATGAQEYSSSSSSSSSSSLSSSKDDNLDHKILIIASGEKGYFEKYENDIWQASSNGSLVLSYGVTSTQKNVQDKAKEIIFSSFEEYKEKNSVGKINKLLVDDINGYCCLNFVFINWDVESLKKLVNDFISQGEIGKEGFEALRLSVWKIFERYHVSQMFGVGAEKWAHVEKINPYSNVRQRKKIDKYKPNIFSAKSRSQPVSAACKEKYFEPRKRKKQDNRHNETRKSTVIAKRNCFERKAESLSIEKSLGLNFSLDANREMILYSLQEIVNTSLAKKK